VTSERTASYSWDHDPVMRALVALPDPVGSLVGSFPGLAGVADDPHWLDPWFVRLIEAYASGRAPAEVTLTAASAEESGADLRVLAKTPVQRQVRLISIEPHYFRGFREIEYPIALDDDLIVFEGRNSSGKTSLSEAVEWVFTGGLSRRSSGLFGHPRELANCIANEFAPDDAEPWVELLLSVDGERVRLRRTLKEDYSSQQGSEAVSVLTIDGVELDRAGEAAWLDDLFAGLHPILMQHTLRQFVHDQPAARRRYFERLLQIDELTELIARAVVGSTTVESFKPRSGSPALEAINSLVSGVEDPEAKAELTALTTADPGGVQEAFRRSLVTVANRTFPEVLDPAISFSQCRDTIEAAQAKARESELPLLGVLRNPLGNTLPDLTKLRQLEGATAAGVVALQEAEAAAESLDEANRALARAFDILVAGGLIDAPTEVDQPCPLCLAPEDTLKAARVSTVASWTPIAGALDRARNAHAERQRSLKAEVESLQASVRGFKVPLPKQAALATMLENLDEPLLSSIREVCTAATQLAEAADRMHLQLGNVREEGVSQLTALEELTTAHQTYGDLMSGLEDLVSASAREDATYLVRERWVAAAGTVSSLAGELQWREARKKAQSRLESIRTALIRLREEIIEDARRTFSEQITEVWGILRSDTGAKFSRLQIPSARGRGYKLELEVKATLSDGTKTREVDALRVFSESQVNVIGIAAYVTRARLLGHRVLIFDDPVQSMDEEHFRTFADTLVARLLDEGFQVVIFTHSDDFARRLSHYHYLREGYATLRTRFSKRKGCQVDEGNRRVPERLKTAERLGEDGKLEDGWRLVRLSIERLYTLVKVGADASFDPDSWRNTTAEDMWNRGVGEVIEGAVPGSGDRLKEILAFAATGAHDKTATSQTDLNDAIGYLRSLLAPLRVGG